MSEPSMELEQPSFAFKPRIDRRPTIPEPLPVRLLAIDDVHLPAAAGREVELDAFYIGLWGFERDESAPEGVIAYHAENFRLCFDVLEPPIHRDEIRPIGVVIHSLAEAEQKLIDHQFEYERQRSITPGEELIVLLDPAGNWIALNESREVG
jgi:hypothetical protein